jgi:hypothetical protein
MTAFGRCPRVELEDDAGRILPHPTPIVPGQPTQDADTASLIALARQRAVIAAFHAGRGLLPTPSAGTAPARNPKVRP